MASQAVFTLRARTLDRSIQALMTQAGTQISTQVLGLVAQQPQVLYPVVAQVLKQIYASSR